MIKIFEKFNEPVKREEYYDNGQKRYEWWYLNGKKHREDGPAIQYWYFNGQKLSEIWLLNGKRNRKNGPSHQTWYENGQKKYEEWYLNNKYHREDGPAAQRWSYNGKKLTKTWWLNGIDYSREEWIEKLKKIGSPHYDEQMMLLNIEKYNL